jgi:hypothetical protein
MAMVEYLQSMDSDSRFSEEYIESASAEITDKFKVIIDTCHSKDKEQYVYGTEICWHCYYNSFKELLNYTKPSKRQALIKYQLAIRTDKSNFLNELKDFLEDFHDQIFDDPNAVSAYYEIIESLKKQVNLSITDKANLLMSKMFELSKSQEESLNFYDYLISEGVQTSTLEVGEIARHLKSKGYINAAIHKDGASGALSFSGIEFMESIFAKSEVQVSTTVSKPLLTPSTNKNDVFISYSWDTQKHQDRVVSFCNFLRNKGYHAEIDKLINDKQTATNFDVMMHRGFTDYRKVIVVLSEGFKQKAESFQGGAGNEYTFLISDIDYNPTKYILVCLDPYTISMCPLKLKGRDVVDLSDKSNITRLFAKLNDEPITHFEDVAETRPVISPEQTESFEKLMDYDRFEDLPIFNSSAEALAALGPR